MKLFFFKPIHHHMKQSDLACVFFVAVLAFSACNSDSNDAQQHAQQAPAVQVTAFEVTKERVNVSETFPGTVTALNQTELRAEVNGYITAIMAADGATVSKGQALYEIDRIRYQSTRDQAKANLEIAEANLQKVETDVKRYETLAEQDAIAKQTLDYARTDLSSARAQVISAKAALTTAETDLKRSIITAPFAGTIGISQVRVGALVSAGSTLLNTVSSTNPMAVDIPINERDLAQFSRLQKSAPDSTFSLMLPNNERYGQQGRLTILDRAFNPQTGTLTARVVFPNPDHLLRAGMNGNLTVSTQDSGEQLVIPAKAVTQRLSASFVFLVTDSSTVKEQEVKLGALVQDKIVVREGLNVGNTIVVDGIQNMREGMKVQVITPGQSQNAQQVP